MAYERVDKPKYPQELIDNTLRDIVAPKERAEKEVLLGAFGTTLFILDEANLSVPEAEVQKVITEADVDAMVAQIEDPKERARMKQVTMGFYKSFGIFHD